MLKLLMLHCLLLLWYPLNPEVLLPLKTHPLPLKLRCQPHYWHLSPHFLLRHLYTPVLSPQAHSVPLPPRQVRSVSKQYSLRILLPTDCFLHFPDLLRMSYCLMFRLLYHLIPTETLRFLPWQPVPPPVPRRS
jgi:hypothetical protein